jgi:hypothetical protein
MFYSYIAVLEFKGEQLAAFEYHLSETFTEHSVFAHLTFIPS